MKSATKISSGVFYRYIPANFDHCSSRLAGVMSLTVQEILRPFLLHVESNRRGGGNEAHCSSILDLYRVMTSLRTARAVLSPPSLLIAALMLLGLRASRLVMYYESNT
jgi:hypothetical protein